MFFWNSLAFWMIQRISAIWSLIPLPFLNPAWTSGSSQFTYYWSLAWKNFEHYFASMWDECNCAVVWLETVTDFIFGGSKNTAVWWLQPWNLKMLAPWKKSYDQPREHIKKQRHYFANKGPSSQSSGFFSSHVWMWELDCKESRVPKNWCFRIVVLEKTLESPLDCKEIQPVHPKGDQSWVLGGLMLKLKLQHSGHLMQRVNIRKRPWCWQRLKTGGEGDNRGWDGCMASPTQWTWVWVNSGS